MATRVPRTGAETLAQVGGMLARRRRQLRANVDQWESEREDLASYIPAVHRTDAGLPAFPPPHVQTFIEAIENDSLGHTLIIAPPGSAKTNTLIAANCWQIGRDPLRHYGYLSSTGPQAARRSVAVRDVIAKSMAYRAIFPDVEPDYRRGWAESEWTLQRPDVGDKDPTFLAAGVLGAIQGSRIDKFSLDDIADPKNMATPYLREKVIKWLKDVVLTRLTPAGRIVMICTRWAADDPAGWAIKEGWRTIRIKAVDENGESYWPERWPINKLACPHDEHGHGDPAWEYSEDTPEPPCWVDRDDAGNIIARGRCAKSTMTSANFELVYQGNTTDDASAIFKRQYWRRYPEGGLRRQGTAGIFVDLAHEEKTTADYTVIARWHHSPPSFYVADVIRRRLEFPEVVQLLRALTRHDLRSDQWPTNAAVLQELARAGRHRREDPAPWAGIQIVIEDTPGSKPLIQTLRREVPGVIAWAIEGRSKEARANAVAHYAEAGNIYIPESAPWVGDWIEEHAAFGSAGAEHDDQVDTTTMALLRLSRGGRLTTW